MIVSTNDFRVEAQIPALFPLEENIPSNSIVSERIQSFIDKYEPIFLYKFFGCDSDKVSEILDYWREGAGNAVYDELLRKLKAPIVNYVAYQYFRNETIVNTTIGGVVEQGENGKKNSSIWLCTKLWNEMCELNRMIYCITLKESCPNTEVFKYVNAMNL
ncbi:MAG: hypothetical protein PUF10_02865 [Bacteroidales bacterium]|nr:hypothetical protein [Bacteroidales bacterium]